MTFCLDSTIIKPEKNQQINNAIILLHGYGGDGKDISMLAINWQRFLPDAIFLCLNAPESCSINPGGYQWFDLSSDKEEIILEKSLEAEEKLSSFLDQACENYNLPLNKLSLVGFSQGCMMSIQIGLKKKQKINSLIGYSGKIINKKHLSESINSKPKVFLMHGADDPIVSPTHLLEAKEFLKINGIKVKTKIFNNCEHKIPIEGSSLGLEFLKQNLL